MWSQPRTTVGTSDASSGWRLSNSSEFKSYCWGAFIQSSKHSESHLCFLLGLLCKFDFQMNLVDLESELFPINVNTRLCDKHCFTNSKVTQKLGWCLYNFITMSMTGCGVKVASQTVKSIKLGCYLATLLPRSGSTSCLTCEKRGTWLPTSQLNPSTNQKVNQLRLHIRWIRSWRWPYWLSVSWPLAGLELSPTI